MIGTSQSQCSKNIFLSNETRTFAISKKTDDVCLVVSPPEEDTFIATIIKSGGLQIHIDGDQEMAPSSSMDKQHCLILTFSKHCEVWQDRRKDICPGSLTVLTIHGPTTVRLRANSNSTEDHVNSTASISYLPVGQYNGVLQDCIDVEPPTTITTEEITEPTELTPEQPTTQSSVTTEATKTTVLMKTIHLTSESITSDSLVTTSSKDGNDLEDEHENDLSTLEIIVIVIFANVVCFVAIGIVVWVVYYRRDANPKDVENGGVSGDDLLNGNQRVTSNLPGESLEMQPVVRTESHTSSCLTQSRH